MQVNFTLQELDVGEQMKNIQRIHILISRMVLQMDRNGKSLSCILSIGTDSAKTTFLHFKLSPRSQRHCENHLIHYQMSQVPALEDPD